VRADVSPVPRLSHQAQIDVRAPATVAFAVVERGILEVVEDPASISGHRPLDAGPVRKGFRWQQTLVHERRVCRSDWVVAQVDAPRVLEQTMEHLCAVSRRVVRGGERWELEDDGEGGTTVTLNTWRCASGLDGWLQKVFGDRQRGAIGISLRKRLAYVQFAAERVAEPPVATL
jgi:hypothetical protein